MCRESFVVHRDFIEDLPEEYKATFLMYAYNYGINGDVPNLTGLEKALWVKIQRRIDYDSSQWEETKLTRSEAGRLGGKKSGEARRTQTKQNEAKLQCAKQNEANEANEAKLQCTKQSEANEAVYVTVTDDVIVTDDVTVTENSCNAFALTAQNVKNEADIVEDEKKIEEAYFDHYSKLYKRGIMNMPKPDINYGQCRKLERDKLKKFGLEAILLALQRGAEDDFCVQKGYSLSMILSSGMFNSLVNGNDWKKHTHAIDAVDRPDDIGEVVF